jgi:hypothetical protein
MRRKRKAASLIPAVYLLGSLRRLNTGLFEVDGVQVIRAIARRPLDSAGETLEFSECRKEASRGLDRYRPETGQLPLLGEEGRHPSGRLLRSRLRVTWRSAGSPGRLNRIDEQLLRICSILNATRHRCEGGVGDDCH